MADLRAGGASVPGRARSARRASQIPRVRAVRGHRNGALNGASNRAHGNARRNQTVRRPVSAMQAPATRFRRTPVRRRHRRCKHLRRRFRSVMAPSGRPNNRAAGIPGYGVIHELQALVTNEGRCPRSVHGPGPADVGWGRGERGPRGRRRSPGPRPRGRWPGEDSRPPWPPGSRRGQVTTASRPGCRRPIDRCCRLTLAPNRPRGRGDAILRARAPVVRPGPSGTA